MQMSWTYREGPSRVCTSRTVASASCPAGNTRKGRPASYNGSPAKTNVFGLHFNHLHKTHHRRTLTKYAAGGILKVKYKLSVLNYLKSALNEVDGSKGAKYGS